MIKSKIADYIKKVVKKDAGIEVFAPENEQFGHYSTNAALKLAKELKKNPMEIAEEIKSQIANRKSQIISRVEIAAPGFVNFWLSEKILRDELKEILKKKDNYGKSQIMRRKAQKIQIEFISANPTGPLTLANGRGGFFGDVLANILEFYGYKVEREYYVNDTGNQILTLGKSILSANGFIKDEENFYKGGYVKDWAEKHKSIVEKYKNNPLKIGQMAAADFLKDIKIAVKKAGINFDRWTSEKKDIHKKSFIDKVLDIFKKADLTYEKDGALWLKTSDFGDEKDRVLITKDNFPTYFLADAGHYLETKKRGFDLKINILGPDHHGYVKRIQAAANILGFKSLSIIASKGIRTMRLKNIKETLLSNAFNEYLVFGGPGSTVAITQAVRLMKGGEEIKMSKRKGEFITFDELINEAGVDATRFFFLMYSLDTHMNFDLSLAKERSMKNPVYYIQYAAVRCQSILRKVQSAKRKTSIDLKLLNTKEDLDLMRILARFPEAVEEAAENYNPQILTRYSMDLARQFHNFYEKERVIGEEKDLAAARLALIQGVLGIFKIIFKLLGVNLLRKM